MINCHYCEATDDLRPYGPGGAPICYPCMKASPDREEAAGRAYGTLLDAVGAISPLGIVTIGEAGGPRTATIDEIAALPAERPQ